MSLRSGTAVSTAQNQPRSGPKEAHKRPSKRAKHSVEQSDLPCVGETMVEPAVSSELLVQQIAAAHERLRCITADLRQLEAQRASQAYIDDLLEDKKTVWSLIDALTNLINLPARQVEVQMELERFRHQQNEHKHAETMEQLRNEDRADKRKFELEMMRASNKPATSTNTVGAIAPEAQAVISYNGAIEVPSLPELFVAIDQTLSDKLDRRSISLMEVPPPIIIDSQQEVAPLLVANKLTEEVQYKMLENYVRALGPDPTHFVVDDDSNTIHLKSALGQALKIDHAVMSQAMAGQAKTALNMAFVVEQKVSNPNHERAQRDGFSQLHTYMHAILRQSGPGNYLEPHKANRTHVIGILLYRQAFYYRPPDNTPVHWTIPAVDMKLEDFISKERKKDQGYSKLVADVYVLFHPAFISSPQLLRLSSTVDAATLLTELFAPSTTYADMQRSFGMTAFTTVAVGPTSYQCVRYLGHGAIADVWACLPATRGPATDEEQMPHLRASTCSSSQSSDGSPTVAVGARSEDMLVLKRATKETISLNHEYTILTILLKVNRENAGVTFPRCIALSDDETCLVTRPVCYRIISGGQIRRFGYANKDPAYMQRLGNLFVDYVTTLKMCHDNGVVHCDIALRNLMAVMTAGQNARGCLIDWDCACLFDKETGLVPERVSRGSLETASERVLTRGEYGPTDDLIALVRCWKIVTQLATYKQVKAWTQLRSRHEDRDVLIRIINDYWDEQRGELDGFAEGNHYGELRNYFANPRHIPVNMPPEPDFGEDELHEHPLMASQLV